MSAAALRAAVHLETSGRAGDIEHTVEAIVRARAGLAADRAVLVGISGIDASGKGYVTERLAAALQARGVNVASIGIDPWQHPQRVRLSTVDPGAHFYANAIRWPDLFERLIDPLVGARSIDIVESVIRTDVDRHYPKQYRFTNVDVVLLEGIFLFRRELAARFDVRIWIECSFETALARALVRNQEGVTPAQLAQDFSKIYFAAQRLHFERDTPRARAHLSFSNDVIPERGSGR